MNMKRTLTAILASALAVSAMSISAFAYGGTVDQGLTPDHQDTEVKYSVAEGYLVTIPAEVTINGAAARVSAGQVRIRNGKNVVVKLTGAAATNTTPTLTGFKVDTVEGAVTEYTVKKDNDTVELGDTVLTVASAGNGGTGSVDLTFEAADTAFEAAGDYSGTVTFTVSVE